MNVLANVFANVFDRRFELFGLSPTATLTFGGAVAAALLLLHFFRRRPRRVVVAFAPLWLKAVRRQRRLFGLRPRQTLGLLLRLALAALLLGVVADPRLAPSRHHGRNFLLLVDGSIRARVRVDDRGESASSIRAADSFI